MSDLRRYPYKHHSSLVLTCVLMLFIDAVILTNQAYAEWHGAGPMRYRVYDPCKNMDYASKHINECFKIPRGREMPQDVVDKLFGHEKNISCGKKKLAKYDAVLYADREMKSILDGAVSFLEKRDYAQVYVPLNMINLLLRFYDEGSSEEINQTRLSKAEAVFLKDCLGAFVATGDVNFSIAVAVEKLPRTHRYAAMSKNHSKTYIKKIIRELKLERPPVPGGWSTTNTDCK